MLFCVLDIIRPSTIGVTGNAYIYIYNIYVVCTIDISKPQVLLTNPVRAGSTALPTRIFIIKKELESKTRDQVPNQYSSLIKPTSICILYIIHQLSNIFSSARRWHIILKRVEERRDKKGTVKSHL